MASVRTISDIYKEVGEVIIESMIYTLTRPSRATKYPLSKNDNLIKQLDYDVNFQQRDIKSGRFKTLELSIFMPQYGEALDKGRQGTEKNKNIKTNWANGRVTGVPIEALVKFIRKRNLQSKIRGKKGRFLSINSIAFILQRSIKRNGINPRNFIAPALEEGEKVLQFHLDRNLLDILTDEFIVS